MSKASSQVAIPRLIVAAASGLQTRQIADALAANLWTIICRDSKGRIKEIDYMKNIVVTAGLNKYLDATLKTGLASPAWYLGLTDASPTVDPTDVMSSHVGWTEIYTEYDETNRVTWTSGTIAAGSVDNSASPARFTINSNNTTIGGAFICDDNTKNGTTGTLLAAGAFQAGNKTLDDDDTLDVTLTATQSAA